MTTAETAVATTGTKSKKADTPSASPNATAPRKRVPTTFIVEKQHSVEINDPATNSPQKTKVWLPVKLPESPKDTMAAYRAARSLGKEGTFRVIAVRKMFAVKTEQRVMTTADDIPF